MIGTRGNMLSIARQLFMKTDKASLLSVCAQKNIKATESCGCLQTLTIVRPMSVKPPKSNFKVRSPYKQPGPMKHGYEQKIYDGGILPRLDTPVKSLPKYKHKDSWSTKRALFGQNDYIDILGDGDMHPVFLIKGPAWLRGFEGNEMQRVIRRMKYEGVRMKHEFPTDHHNHKKRIHYLNKYYNNYR